MECPKLQSGLGSDLGGLAPAGILYTRHIAVRGAPTMVNAVLGINGTGHLGASRGHDLDL